MKKTFETLHIVGRRWFNTREGNTYHSVTIYIDDKDSIYIPYAHGYGDGFLQTAIDYLFDNGYIDQRKYGTLFLREELNGTYIVYDVNRKKDL